MSVLTNQATEPDRCPWCGGIFGEDGIRDGRIVNHFKSGLPCLGSGQRVGKLEKNLAFCAACGRDVAFGLSNTFVPHLDGDRVCSGSGTSIVVEKPKSASFFDAFAKLAPKMENLKRTIAAHEEERNRLTMAVDLSIKQRTRVEEELLRFDRERLKLEADFLALYENHQKMLRGEK